VAGRGGAPPTGPALFGVGRLVLVAAGGWRTRRPTSAAAPG